MFPFWLDSFFLIEISPFCSKFIAHTPSESSNWKIQDFWAAAVLLLPLGVLLVGWIRELVIRRKVARQSRAFWLGSVLVCATYTVLYIVPVHSIPYGLVYDRELGLGSGSPDYLTLIRILAGICIINWSWPAILFGLATVYSVVTLIGVRCSRSSGV